MKRLFLPLLLLLSFSAFAQGLSKNDFHTWTDIGGKTLQAQFVKLDGELLTIRLRGPQYNLRLADLNSNSQNLFRYLTTPGNLAAKTKRGEFHDWTNKEGKTIRARIVKALGENLTLEMGGGGNLSSSYPT